MALIGKGESAAEDNQFHVLLVADDATTRCFHNTLLQRHSCKVSTVPNLFGAIRFLGIPNGNGYGNGSIPDMIITDYDLPGMNGYILLELIKNARATRDLRVVVLLPDEMLHMSDLIRSLGGLVFNKPLTNENVTALMNGQN